MLTNEEMHDLMDTYSPYLLQVSFLYVKDWSHKPEDIVQESFIQFLKSYASFEGRASIKTYLTKITIHKCTDYLRAGHHVNERSASYSGKSRIIPMNFKFKSSTVN